MGFLDGLKVLDCTDERGLVAGRLLADMGADVVQVEPPGGSPARLAPPLTDGVSLYWETYAANKRGVVCDLTAAEGRTGLRDLAARSDILIQSADPGTFDRWGLGWPQLHRMNPRLIYVSITAFGQDGPKAGWAATDLTVWAAGGPLAYNQDETGPPLRISVPQTWLHAGADAAAGALLAHRARRLSGRGQHVDVSAQVSLGLCTLAANLTAITGDSEPDWIPKPRGRLSVDQSGSGSRTRRSKWPVRDGYVELHLAIGPAVGAFTNNLFAWLRDEGADPDPTIAGWDWRALPDMIKTGAVTMEQMDEARAIVAAFLLDKTKAEVTEAGLTRKLLAVGIANVSDLAGSGHFADRGFLIDLPGPAGPHLTMPGPVARASTDGFTWRYPAPRLGQHDEQIRAEWLARPADNPAPATLPPAPLRRADGSGARPGPVPLPLAPLPIVPLPLAPLPIAPLPIAPLPIAASPLAGLKVADLSWVVAGPVIGRALADFGATVVRVESSGRIETARHMAPFYGGRPGVENSALYVTCNAGKLGLALDLTAEEGRETVRDLARWADVVVESFTPGLMDRWGLGYERLAAENPGLIMVSSSLMGHTGRLSRLAGYGNIGAAMSGFQYIVGWPDRPPIGPFGPYTDFIGPRLALVALLAALEHRDRTGLGCYLDVSQAECGAWFLSPQIAAYLADGTVPERDGNRDPVFVPHGVFPCRSDGPDHADHVAVAVRDNADFAALATVMDRPDLIDDARYATPDARRTHEPELEALVAAWTSERSATEVERACQAAGVPAHRASRSADIVVDPQLAHLGHLIRLPHPIHGEVVVEGPRYRLSGTPGRVTRPGPTIGQDRDAVLAGILGYSSDRIKHLDASGVLR
jgi:crotonobetainyl-CoA:carnitine CoA-transferase CaiB-like acyl-CoA transferase